MNLEPSNDQRENSAIKRKDHGFFVGVCDGGTWVSSSRSSLIARSTYIHTSDELNTLPC